MKLFSRNFMPWIALLSAATANASVSHSLPAQTVSRGLPSGARQMTSVEGITEYRLPTNGLKILLFPDSSKPIVTVNITYLVGSRHEGYGERNGASG